MTMKECLALVIAVALTGCSSKASSSHTVEVAGSPDEVGSFVTSEKSRNGDADVAHRAGDGRAVFSVETDDALDAVSDRATAAGLNVEARSSSWSVESGSSWSVDTNP